MQLVLRRSQSENKGMLGGHKGITFHLHARASLSDEERALVARYRGVEGTILTTVSGLSGKVPLVNVTVASLMAGQTFDCGDVRVLMAAEHEITGACRVFNQLLRVMESFGGEVVIDFDRESAPTAA